MVGFYIIHSFKTHIYVNTNKCLKSVYWQYNKKLKATEKIKCVIISKKKRKEKKNTLLKTNIYCKYRTQIYKLKKKKSTDELNNYETLAIKKQQEIISCNNNK